MFDISGLVTSASKVVVVVVVVRLCILNVSGTTLALGETSIPIAHTANSPWTLTTKQKQSKYQANMTIMFVGIVSTWLFSYPCWPQYWPHLRMTCAFSLEVTTLSILQSTSFTTFRRFSDQTGFQSPCSCSCLARTPCSGVLIGVSRDPPLMGFI